MRIFIVDSVPAKAVNVNIVGVILSIVCCNPVLQTIAHLLVLIILNTLENVIV